MTAGIGYYAGGTDTDLAHNEPYPQIVLISPSGNMCQVLPFSGVYGDFPGSNKHMHQRELTHSHKTLAWHKNQAVLAQRYTVGTNKQYGMFSWLPSWTERGAAYRKINPATYTTNIMQDKIMYDGYGWATVIGPGDTSTYYNTYNACKVNEGIWWYIVIPAAGYSWTHGTYKGILPAQKVISSVTGHMTRQGGHGNRGLDPSVHIADNNQAARNYAGIKHTAETVDFGASDMLEHDGTMYIAGQYYLYSIDVRGNRGGFIFYDGAMSEDIDAVGEADDYTDRYSAGAYNENCSKSLAKHNNQVWLLDNKGTVYKVYPGKAVSKVDLTNLGKFSSSGIFGGGTGFTANNTWINSRSAYRCKLLSFNGQLNAFLNYKSSYNASNVEDSSFSTDGKGIVWATSYDGENWTDFSHLLPTSGIVSPSGLVGGTAWKATTGGYWFSAMSGPNNLKASGGYSKRFQYGIGTTKFVSGNRIAPAQPSGYSQHQYLKFLTDPSGGFAFDEYTSSSDLPFPLGWHTVSGHLYPTQTKYPPRWGWYNPTTSGWEGSDGDHVVLKPSGTAVAKYDYTGCHNYHIAGDTDEEENCMRLLFTEDNKGEGVHGSTLYYKVTSSSGWTLMNYAAKLNQVNGFVPCSLYDPEIYIPSGTMLNPNPSVDLINRTVSLDYWTHDWPYWHNVDVEFKYSTDKGQHWRNLKTERNVSTGDQISDPSGFLGQKHTLSWAYTNKMHSNNFYSDVRIKARATVKRNVYTPP